MTIQKNHSGYIKVKCVVTCEYVPQEGRGESVNDELHAQRKMLSGFYEALKST